MIPTVMLENIRAKKTDKFEDSQDKVENNQPLIQKMNITFDLNGIRPIFTQMWNCDRIGSNTSRKWNKVIWDYNYFQVN